MLTISYPCKSVFSFKILEVALTKGWTNASHNALQPTNLDTIVAYENKFAVI